MFGLQEIVARNEHEEFWIKAKRVALIKAELAKLDNGEVRKILADLAEKE